MMLFIFRLDDLFLELPENSADQRPNIKRGPLWNYTENNLLDQERHEGAFRIMCNLESVVDFRTRESNSNLATYSTSYQGNRTLELGVYLLRTWRSNILRMIMGPQ